MFLPFVYFLFELYILKILGGEELLRLDKIKLTVFGTFRENLFLFFNPGKTKYYTYITWKIELKFEHINNNNTEKTYNYEWSWWKMGVGEVRQIINFELFLCKFKSMNCETFLWIWPSLLVLIVTFYTDNFDWLNLKRLFVENIFLKI